MRAEGLHLHRHFAGVLGLMILTFDFAIIAGWKISEKSPTFPREPKRPD